MSGSWEKGGLTIRVQGKGTGPTSRTAQFSDVSRAAVGRMQRGRLGGTDVTSELLVYPYWLCDFGQKLNLSELIPSSII